MRKNLDGATPAEDDPFGKKGQEETRRRRRRRRTAIAGGVAVLLVVVVSVYAIYRGERCGPGVDRIAGECIGVTDGSVDFATDASTKTRLHEVDQLIYKENQRIRVQKQPYVTVALLGALSVTPEHNLTGGRAVNEIEGAAIAQKRANDGQAGGNSPQIKLVLANEGADQSHWKRVVDQLIEMRDSDHLVAVIGFGISTRETILAAQRLSREHIAMVEDLTSADGFDTTGAALTKVGETGGRIDGLTRVAVPESQRIAAMARYLKGPNFKPQSVKSAVIVVDRKAADLYSQSLATGYRAAFKEALTAGRRRGSVEEPLTADSPDQPGIKVQYDRIARNLNLCGDKPPDIVLYAGRTIFLPDLIGYLENCEQQPIRIVTGSDAEGITSFPPGDVSILYTPSADWQQLKNSGSKSYNDFVKDAKRYYKHFSESRDLRDSWAIMAHDALLTAALATRQARGGDVPPSEDVANTLYGLHATDKVIGASGNIEMDMNGNPLHPSVKIVRLNANGDRESLYP